MPSGTGHFDGYSVEARYDYSSPVTIGDLTLDNRWRRVAFPKGHPGVPVGPGYHAPFLNACGLMAYSSAQAMRWWLHASAEAYEGGGGLCLETRIVKHRVRYSYGATRETEHCLVGGDDRSNIMPDWGKKSEASTPAKAAE